MTIKGILFDLDGTLIDSLSSVEDTMIGTAKEMNIEMDNEHFMSLVGTPLQYMAEQTTPPGRADEFLITYKKLYPSYCKQSLKLYENIKDLLYYLRSKGLKVAIVTSKAKDATMNNLNFLGIENSFDAIITAYDAPKAKPNPEPVEMAAHVMNLSIPECVMIGDTFFDIEAGRSAGTDTIGVTWGNASKKEIDESNPTYIAHTVPELRKVIDSLI